MNQDDIQTLLDDRFLKYHQAKFVEDDPIVIPHQFSAKEDIEIAALLVSLLAWGNRKSIIRSGTRLMDSMDRAPYDFILNHEDSDLKRLTGFVHRTVNADDMLGLVAGLKHIYKKHGGLEEVFAVNVQNGMDQSIDHFRTCLFEAHHLRRTEKHVSSPAKGSAAKRINMFLRWMVRDDSQSVDFGIWKGISTAHLMLPLDVHTACVSRKLGLLKRKSNDWKAVAEVTDALRQFDPNDPVKYDFALFGLGALEDFCK